MNFIKNYIDKRKQFKAEYEKLSFFERRLLFKLSDIHSALMILYLVIFAFELYLAGVL